MRNEREQVQVPVQEQQIPEVPQRTSSADPVGYWKSTGSANGNKIYEGPQGGLYYINSSGNKRYVTGHPSVILY